ncbi:MAG: hypothetical protein IPK60_16910 [Sandaracinaceae bacterium]|nr:hypothetical protein [Sandaracinaceae bacterium]
MSRKGMSAEAARAWLSEQELSGESIHDFAVSRGLTPSTLYLWRRRFASSPALVRVHVKEAPAPLRTTSALEVVTRSGHVVRIAHDFDTAALARLLRVLESSGC